MIIHKQLLEICLFDNSTDTLHLHLHTLHIETVTHSSSKDCLFLKMSGFFTQWQYFPVNFLTFNFSIVSYSNALKCYSRARDYCTTAKHVINMCVNVIKVGPATYFFAFNISPSSMLVIRVCAHHGSIPVSWSIQQKKHGIWITKNWFFPQECQSNNDTVIEWSFN